MLPATLPYFESSGYASHVQLPEKKGSYNHGCIAESRQPKFYLLRRHEAAAMHEGGIFCSWLVVRLLGEFSNDFQLVNLCIKFKV